MGEGAQAAPRTKVGGRIHRWRRSAPGPRDGRVHGNRLRGRLSGGLPGHALSGLFADFFPFPAFDLAVVLFDGPGTFAHASGSRGLHVVEEVEHDEELQNEVGRLRVRLALLAGLSFTTSAASASRSDTDGRDPGEPFEVDSQASIRSDPVFPATSVADGCRWLLAPRTESYVSCISPF